MLHSVSDSLLVSLLSPRFKIFIGRIFERLAQTQVRYHAMWAWTGQKHKILICCIVYYAYTNMHGNTNNCNDDFYKWTNTLLYKNLFLTLYSRKGGVCCVWEMIWRMGQTAILTQVLLSTIAALLPHLGWVTQPWVTEGPRPSICSWLSLWHPVSDCFEPSGHLVILFSTVHLLPLFFRLFTQVHLLIDGSVEGQYITLQQG